MNPIDIVVGALDYAIKLGITLLGADQCKQVMIQRAEILAARAAADAEVAAKAGNVPPQE